MSNIGFYLSFEGIDGIGKSTQIPLLAERLRKEFPDREIVTSFEPGGSAFGKEVRELLFNVKKGGVVNLHPVASGLLYLSDHIQHQHEKVAPAVQRGAFVIQDRSFIDSQRAYYDQGEHDKCYAAHPILHPECIKPDLTILLTLSPQICLDRAVSRGDAKFLAKPWSNVASLTTIQKRYTDMAAVEPDRFVIIELSASMSADAVAFVVFGTVLEFMARRRNNG